MRGQLIFFLFAALFGGCHDEPRSLGTMPDEPTAFPSFAIRNDSDLDSLARGPKITSEEALAWSEALTVTDTCKCAKKAPSSPVVLGRMRTGKGSVCLLFRELHLTEDEGTGAEVLLVEEPGDGGKAVKRKLAGYGMSAFGQEICSVEWQAPALRVQDQAQWITKQDSLLRFHIAQRTISTEIHLTDHVQVMHQDTSLVIRDLDENGRILPNVKRRIR
jgi:hypothetical protein